MKTLTIAIILLTTTTVLFSQYESRILAGTEFPVSYTMGFEQSVSERISIRLCPGILTKPYDRIIITVLENFGVEKPLTRTIGEAFSYGLVGTAGLNYHFKGIYAGIQYKYLLLKANDTRADLINNYFGTSLPEITLFDRPEYTLISALHSGGILMGYEKILNQKISLLIELTVSKSFYSSSQLKSDNSRFIDVTSNVIDRELKEYYRKYAWLPSLNILISYSL